MEELALALAGPGVPPLVAGADPGDAAIARAGVGVPDEGPSAELGPADAAALSVVPVVAVPALLEELALALAGPGVPPLVAGADPGDAAYAIADLTVKDEGVSAFLFYALTRAR